jgi:hypothetical protein
MQNTKRIFAFGGEGADEDADKDAMEITFSAILQVGNE